MDFLQIILTPFSWLLKTFITVFGNYGVALIMFALVIKVILFPLSLKGKKSMIQMTILSGQMKEIQKRCGTDRDRYNREVQELYSKNNVNPMGGCLWSMLPMPILIALYAIIRRPFYYIMHLSDTAITAIADKLGYAAKMGTDFLVNGKISGYNELYLSAMMNSGNVEAAATAAGVGVSSLFIINFNFLGLDLAQVPTLKFWEGGLSWSSIGLFLLPVISAGLSYVSMRVSTKTNAMNQQQEDAAAAQNKMMMLMMPLMSLWIGFIMPAGLCIYWIANSVFQMAQEIICSKMLKKDYEEAQRQMEERAAAEKLAEKERRREAAERKAAALAEKKSGKKKAAAKKEQPETEVTDKSASRVGMRQYARGRAYDPNRYPVTEYRDPNEKKKAESEEEPAALTEEETALLNEAPVTAIPAETVVDSSTENTETVEASDGETDFEAAYEEESETPKQDEN